MEVLDINRIKEIRKQIKKLKDEEKKLLSPTLKDFSKVSHVVEIMKGHEKPLHVYGQSDSTTQRQAKIFIILYLFSPGTLVGEEISRGLRRVLSSEMKVSPPLITNHAKSVSFLWINYSDFREYVEYLWCEVQARLDLETSMGP